VVQYKYPYHLGVYENFKSVLGPSVFLWCLPQKMRGDGLKYRVAEGLREFHAYSDSESEGEAGVELRTRRRVREREEDAQDVV
jgi:hypothetical protein